MTPQEVALYNLYEACRKRLNDTCQDSLRREMRDAKLALSELAQRLRGEQ